MLKTIPDPPINEAVSIGALAGITGSSSGGAAAQIRGAAVPVDGGWLSQ